MKRLWASWRMKYISGDSSKHTGCVFCDALDKPNSVDTLILERGRSVFAILNKYPYTSGHVMVAPIKHLATPEHLDTETSSELMQFIIRYSGILNKVYHPEGFNIGANIGAAAGAGVPGHLHFHIVPRWNGDTNYMTTVGEIRVIPEDLQDTYARISKVLSGS